MIEKGPVARKILQHLGLPSESPRLDPARTDQADFWPTGPPPDAGEPPLMVRLSNHDLVDQRSAFAAEDVDQRSPYDLSA